MKLMFMASYFSGFFRIQRLLKWELEELIFTHWAVITLLSSGPFDPWQIRTSSLEESNSQSHYQFITSNLTCGLFILMKTTDRGKNMEWISFIFSSFLSFQTFTVNKRQIICLAGNVQLSLHHNYQDTFKKPPANVSHTRVLTAGLAFPSFIFNRHNKSQQ